MEHYYYLLAGIVVAPHLGKNFAALWALFCLFMGFSVEMGWFK